MEIVWDWKSIGSLLATMVFIRSAARDFLPPELREFLRTLFTRIYTTLRPTSTFIIDEFDSSSGSNNELFDASQSYLSSRCLSSAPVLRLYKTKHSKSLTSSLPSSHSTTDIFHGVELKWSSHSITRPSASAFARSSGSEHRYLELTFHRRHRAFVHAEYVPFVVEEAARLKSKSRERKLYTNRAYGPDDHHGGHGLWSSVPFKHPSTFETLAIDPDLRDSIRNDLLRFSARREYYARVGRAWKRGYLLHGPPGTGKTSLIAAIANFLDFDLYDLELTAVHSNIHLRKLLVSTSPKSVVVVEDVDCSLDLTDRTNKFTKKQSSASSVQPNTTQSEPGDDGNGNSASPAATVSLSGVLNFVDGLWSSCVGERLIIFTTNHPERLDPALLRPGRMDRRIHLSYCKPSAFRVLARNYLEVEEHEMMGTAENLLEEVKMTPAEIAEVFMGCDGHGADVGMEKVVEELRKRKKAMLFLPTTTTTTTSTSTSTNEEEVGVKLTSTNEEEVGVKLTELH